MADREEWVGLIAGQRAAGAEVEVVAPLRPSQTGGSGAFLALCGDDRRYWLKPLNNGQGELVPATEQIVGRAGRLIGAPTCEVRTALISPEIAGWEFHPGKLLETGIAHASLHVEDIAEVRRLSYRTDDDNQRRHLQIMALYDWCFGADAQWLTAVKASFTFYSHDHGWYLPPNGANFSEEAMVANLGTPRELKDEGDGIDAAHVAEVAAALRSVTREHLVTELRAVPASWPVTDSQLECAGYFLENRALDAAGRIEARFGGKA